MGTEPSLALQALPRARLLSSKYTEVFTQVAGKVQPGRGGEKDWRECYGRGRDPVAMGGYESSREKVSSSQTLQYTRTHVHMHAHTHHTCIHVCTHIYTHTHTHTFLRGHPFPKCSRPDIYKAVTLGTLQWGDSGRGFLPTCLI